MDAPTTSPALFEVQQRSAGAVPQTGAIFVSVFAFFYLLSMLPGSLERVAMNASQAAQADAGVSAADMGTLASGEIRTLPALLVALASLIPAIGLVLYLKATT